jgi:hypothetical protein
MAGGPRPARSRLRALLASLAVVLALPVDAHAGTQHTLTRTSGPVTATVSWVEADFFLSSDVQVEIVRDGEALLSEPILDGEGLPVTDTPQALRLRDLDGDSEPEILVDLYTNGAHCCFRTRLYEYDPATLTYQALEHLWGNASYALKDLDGDGLPELKSADDRFAYAFTAYAGSAFPLQIWRLEAGELADVTRTFRSLVRADAARWWKIYVRERGEPGSDVRGVLAAWTADKRMLGEGREAFRRLALARRAGELAGPKPWPSGKRYITALRRFLAELGYR